MSTQYLGVCTSTVVNASLLYIAILEPWSEPSLSHLIDGSSHFFTFLSFLSEIAPDSLLIRVKSVELLWKSSLRAFWAWTPTTLIIVMGESPWDDRDVTIRGFHVVKSSHSFIPRNPASLCTAQLLPLYLGSSYSQNRSNKALYADIYFRYENHCQIFGSKGPASDLYSTL